MSRPCFLVVDQEFPGSISSRKLVLETAKYNVITAYSREEAAATLIRFPKVDGVVLGVGMGSDVCRELTAELKAINRSVPIILTAGDGTSDDYGVDHVVPSFDPAKLLERLRTICGHSAESLQRHESSLEQSQG